jgi:hypothetical protein
VTTAAHLVIDKLTAAARQLDCAIRLTANSEDALAIHTLTMATFGIVEPLSRGQELYEAALRPALTALGRDKLVGTANFLKHADRDPDGITSPPLDHDNDWRIGVCAMLYRRLSGNLTPYMAAFHMWVIVRHPNHFNIQEDDDPDFEAAYRASLALVGDESRSVQVVLLDALIKAMLKGDISTTFGLKRRPLRQDP